MIEVLVWLGVALIGIVVAYFGIREAVRDYRVLKGVKKNGVVEIVVRTSIRNSTGRLITQLMFATVGVNALLEGPRWVNIWGLIIPAILLVVTQALEIHDRRIARRVYID